MLITATLCPPTCIGTQNSLCAIDDAISGDCGSGVQGSLWHLSPSESRSGSGSLWQMVNTCLRITLISLAWLVCSWSATPEMATKRRCIRSSALANPAGPLFLRPVFLGHFDLLDWGSDAGEEAAIAVAAVVARGVTEGRLCFGSCRKRYLYYNIHLGQG